MFNVRIRIQEMLGTAFPHAEFPVNCLVFKFGQVSTGSLSRCAFAMAKRNNKLNILLVEFLYSPTLPGGSGGVAQVKKSPLGAEVEPHHRQ